MGRTLSEGLLPLASHETMNLGSLGRAERAHRAEPKGLTPRFVHRSARPTQPR